MIKRRWRLRTMVFGALTLVALLFAAGCVCMYLWPPDWHGPPEKPVLLTVEDVVGRWRCTSTLCHCAADVTVFPDGTFSETVIASGQPPHQCTGKWRIDGTWIWFENMWISTSQWEFGSIAWRGAPDPSHHRRITLRGSMNPDPDVVEDIVYVGP